MNRLFKKTAALLLIIAMLCGCRGEAAAPDTVEQAELPVYIDEPDIPDEPDPIEVTAYIGRPDISALFDADSLFSEGVYMVELETDTVVFSKEPDKRLIPASLTKIMTAVVCLEQVSDLSAPVECPEICFKEFTGEDDPNFDGASGAGIEPGQDNLTYRDCLYGLMLPSGCEAGNIIAYNVCNGDMSAFPELMNKTAAKIGCQNTHFTNAHGLYEEENYSTARDMYLITRYAMENCPEFMSICSAAEYQMPPNKANPDGYKVQHTNRMARQDSEYYYDGVYGVKTGSIDEYFTYNSTSGEWEKVETRGVNCLVAICDKNGFRYLLSTLDAPFYEEDGSRPKNRYQYADHKALFDFVLREFSLRKIISKGEVILTAPVNYGGRKEVEVVAGGDYSALLPVSVETDEVLELILPEYIDPINAPVKKGDELGEIVIKSGGKPVTAIPLVAKSSVESENYSAA